VTRPTDPISVPGADYAEDYVEVDDGVRLRVLHWTPRPATAAAPVVFVAGFVSSVYGWAEFLRAAASTRPVWYIETREKGSARIERRVTPADFAIPRLAEDIIAASLRLPIDRGRAILMGSSFGATAVLEALKNGRLAARAAFLVGPNTEFRASRPLWSLTYLPAAFYHPVKHFVIWYLRTFRVDTKREPEQMLRYKETLGTANPLRVKFAARALKSYSVWQHIETVEIPVGIGYAASDTLHSEANIRRMAETLPRALTISFPTNKAMHGADLMSRLDEFLLGLRD
jgi:pimeloyl-ACP methyl ester carboxylesterase